MSKPRGGREYLRLSSDVSWRVTAAFARFAAGGIEWTTGNRWHLHARGGVDYYCRSPFAAVGTPLFCRLFGYPYEEPPA